MFATDDPIVAIATPPGRGGIGVVRISGPGSSQIARTILQDNRPLAPRYATYTQMRLSSSAPVNDEVIATFFPAPGSYTGQDVVEISAHGSPVVLAAIVRAAIEAGARLARPGEFTLRAFLMGKRDLVRAEAVADLVAAATPLQARVAFDQLDGTLTSRIAAIDARLFDLIAKLEASLDFPDEGYHFIDPAHVTSGIDAVQREMQALLADAGHGRLIREGATVVLSGRTNVGKSSVFNYLVGNDRAIVTPIPGTTRDLVTEVVDVGGVAVTLVDTAGWRETDDPVEREGVTRGVRARSVADLTLLILDSSEPLTGEDRALLDSSAGPRLVVANKSELPAAFHDEVDVKVSARTGAGMEALRSLMVARLNGGELLRDSPALSNVRHIDLLNRAHDRVLGAAAAAATGAMPEEFVLADLQEARIRLEEIVGVRTSSEILNYIFERFCVGK